MTETLRSDPRWPRRFLLAAMVAVVPLFLFGGSVTTLGAGMAVEGWWDAEGHFMPLFPAAKWFRDIDTFVEHSHRQFGLVVGLAMLAACVATWISDRRPMARLAVIGATLAVCFQGWLGGSRVLENSPRLAFLHGCVGQAVFALMVAAYVQSSPAWRAAKRRPSTAAAGLRRLAWVAVSVVYAQIVLGAWYRHALRTGLEGDPSGRLHLHLLGALAAFVALMALAARLADVGDEQVEGDLGPLARARRHIVLLFWMQVALGFLAWGLRGGAEVGLAEWALATAHVLVGALLLAQCVAASMWSHRALEPRSTPGLAGARAEGAQ